MCGLIGFSGKEEYNVDKIKMLMLANMWRGINSSGFSVDDKITKDVLRIDEFLAKYEIPKSNIFIGHVRQASVQTTIKDATCSHPFEYDDIIGAHNGYVSNYFALAQKIEWTYKDYTIDSQVVIKSLANKNFNFLSEIKGAAALIFKYKGEDDLYIFTNGERPLCKGYAEEGMYISSTEESLKLIGCTKITDLKENYLYCINNGEIVLPKCKKIKPVIEKEVISTTKLLTTLKQEENVGVFAKYDLISNPIWYLVKDKTNPIFKGMRFIPVVHTFEKLLFFLDYDYIDQKYQISICSVDHADIIGKIEKNDLLFIKHHGDKNVYGDIVKCTDVVNKSKSQISEIDFHNPRNNNDWIWSPYYLIPYKNASKDYIDKLLSDLNGKKVTALEIVSTKGSNKRENDNAFKLPFEEEDDSEDDYKKSLGKSKTIRGLFDDYLETVHSVYSIRLLELKDIINSSDIYGCEGALPALATAVDAFVETSEKIDELAFLLKNVQDSLSELIDEYDETSKIDKRALESIILFDLSAVNHSLQEIQKKNIDDFELLKLDLDCMFEYYNNCGLLE